MIRTQCVRCGLPAEVDYPEEVTIVRCSACSGKLAAVWSPSGPTETETPVGRGRFSRSGSDPAGRASFPTRLR